MSMLNFFHIKFLWISLFNICHAGLVIFSWCFQDGFNLGNSDNREIFGEQEEASEEESECTEIETDLPDSRSIISTPAGRKEVAVDRCNDDYETLIPHTDIHYNRKEECPEDTATDFFAPE